MIVDRINKEETIKFMQSFKDNLNLAYPNEDYEDGYQDCITDLKAYWGLDDDE